MRLFIAFEVSEEVKYYAKDLQKSLPAATYTFPKSFHVTLKFLGDVSPQKAEEIKECLSQFTFEPFVSTTNKMGVFPNESYVRVVWISLEPRDIICDLQSRIDGLLSGLFKKETNFVPHLTIARVKAVNDPDFCKKLMQLPVEKKTFEVKQVKLIEGSLSPEGPVYRDLAVYPPQPL